MRRAQRTTGHHVGRQSIDEGNAVDFRMGKEHAVRGFEEWRVAEEQRDDERRKAALDHASLACGFLASLLRRHGRPVRR